MRCFLPDTGPGHHGRGRCTTLWVPVWGMGAARMIAIRATVQIADGAVESAFQFHKAARSLPSELRNSGAVAICRCLATVALLCCGTTVTCVLVQYLVTDFFNPQVLGCHLSHSLDFAASLICYTYVWPLTFPHAHTFNWDWMKIVIGYGLCCEVILFGFWHWMVYSGQNKPKVRGPEPGSTTGRVNVGSRSVVDLALAARSSHPAFLLAHAGRRSSCAPEVQPRQPVLRQYVLN